MGREEDIETAEFRKLAHELHYIGDALHAIAKATAHAQGGLNHEQTQKIYREFKTHVEKLRGTGIAK